LLIILSYRIDPKFYMDWIVPEGYSFLEFGQFVIISAAFAVAVRLSLDPLVRQRRLVFVAVLLAAVACLYIAGEEVSWGQTFFHWKTPESWAAINVQEETNLHNLGAFDNVFNVFPRYLLCFGVLVGGLGVPLVAAFYPKLRAMRLSLFLPAAALVPAALGTLFFQIDRLLEKLGSAWPVPRPAESVEFYFYTFILAYLIVFARRINELEDEHLAYSERSSAVADLHAPVGPRASRSRRLSRSRSILR
jgi:hypothetical protein